MRREALNATINRKLESKSQRFHLMSGFLQEFLAGVDLSQWNHLVSKIVRSDELDEIFWAPGETRLGMICSLTGLTVQQLANKYREALLDEVGVWERGNGRLPFSDIVRRFYDDPEYPILESLDFVVDDSAQQRLLFNTQCLQVIQIRGGMLCEIGVGSSEILSIARQLQPTFRMFAVDVAKAPLSFAAQRLGSSNIAFVRANILALPYSDSTFDVLLVNEVIEHVTDPVGALQEVQRIIKSGGEAIISTSIGFPSVIHLGEFSSVSHCKYEITKAGFEVKTIQTRRSSLVGHSFTDIFLWCQKG